MDNTRNSTDYQVTFQLTPDQFGSSVIALENFPWPGSNTENTVDINSEVSAKFGASVPLLSQVSPRIFPIAKATRKHGLTRGPTKYHLDVPEDPTRIRRLLTVGPPYTALPAIMSVVLQ
jgi:hypothetical protein